MKGLSKGFKVLMAAGMAVSLLAGCSGGKDSAADGASPAAQGTAAASAPAAGAKPVIKALKAYMAEDYNTYPIAKVLEEKTGYKVQYDQLPQNQPVDKLNLIMASGGDYDIISAGSKDDYFRYAQSGALVELGPIIDQYGPNIKAAVSQESFDATKVDGKIYAIPNKNVAFTGQNILIRQDWLDALGLPTPTTVEEFTAVLKAFKEKDPGKMGAKTIPLTIVGDAAIMEGIIGAYGLPNEFNERNGALVNRVLDPAFKDYVEYMKELYKTGLLDVEFPSNKMETVKEKFTNGRAGAMIAGWDAIPTITDALTKNNPNAKAVYLPVLAGKDGKKGLREYFSLGYSYVPKSSKNAVEVVKWVNALLDKDVFKLMFIGEENVHYTYKDGVYSPILPKFNDERNRSNNYVVGVDEQNFASYWQARVRKDPRLFEAFSSINTKLPDNEKVTDILNYSAYMPQLSKNGIQLNKLVIDYVVKTVTNQEDLSGYTAFVDKWKTAGGEAVVKEVDSWYAGFLKKK